MARKKPVPVPESEAAETPVLPQLHCFRCGHDWTPRAARLPSMCPRCISRRWNKPPEDK